jgi:hypothetical protein
MPFDGLELSFNYLAKLDAVIDLIGTPNTWTKFTYQNPPSGYCLKEALNVVGVAEIFEPIILKVGAEVMDRDFCCAESFNDHPQTAHGDVLTVLHRVRAEIATGRLRFSEHAAAQPFFASQQHDAPTPGNRISVLLRKLFC